MLRKTPAATFWSIAFRGASRTRPRSSSGWNSVAASSPIRRSARRALLVTDRRRASSVDVSLDVNLAGKIELPRAPSAPRSRSDHTHWGRDGRQCSRCEPLGSERQRPRLSVRLWILPDDSGAHAVHHRIGLDSGGRQRAHRGARGPTRATVGVARLRRTTRCHHVRRGNPSARRGPRSRSHGVPKRRTPDRGRVSDSRPASPTPASG